LAAKEIPQLGSFYDNYSKYMLAWMEIEHAKHNHSLGEYREAKNHYENAAKLHVSSEQWSFLKTNYMAWASLEEAECLSRKEQTEKAEKVFQKAHIQFIDSEKAIKAKYAEITSPEEKQAVRILLAGSDMRRRFCQARIKLEEAKLLDKMGKHLQSSISYGEAARKLESFTEKVESEAERKEMEYIAALCKAWGEMAAAEETTSSELYLDAAELFEKAKEYCYTKKASLWTLGNSSFCRGLAAGVDYQTMLNVEDHNKAKGYIQNAATNYFQAGYQNAAEFAKATLRLFDAYLFMNQAERETDTEKRVKQYQLAENLLKLAADSFTEAQQPEKTAQVRQILENVTEEKELAISFNEVLQAPSIASTTQSFTAPTPTSEALFGLEKLQHATVQANLIADLKQVKVGESFCLSVEFVNAGKEPSLLTRVDDFVPSDFIVVKKPEIYRLENSCLNMKGKQIAPLKLVEAKLILQPSKKGTYQLKPTVHYLDELGQSKSLQLKPIEINVEEVVLADRVSTGTRELDSLLLGGIPKEYAVVLTGSPSDERELLIKNFLEAGTGEGQNSFYVTTEATGLEYLLEKPSFNLFLCNPKPKLDIADLPNVTKVRGKTDLTNLNIALLRSYRSVEQSSGKRICIDTVSDILLEYGVKATRKWLAELNTDLVSKGFTVLAVVNPLMHTSEELNSILDLFDGELSLSQSGDPLQCRRFICVKNLRNQDYIKNPVCLRS
jgi:KaiC/GvpD/RAD55 family RecA-like ATPase